jgi:hypothetical protein
LFLYGNSVAAMENVPYPATYCGGRGERFRTAARRDEACRGVGDSGKGSLTANCRRVPPEGNCCYDCCRALCGN